MEDLDWLQCIIVECAVGEAHEMVINSNLTSHFSNSKLKRSESGKIILKYDMSESSDNLFKFLSFHPAIRVAFNSMVKADFISLEKAIIYLPDLLDNAKTSLVFETNCECKNILDKPHVYDLFNGRSEEKSITCPNCKKVNRLNIADYKLCKNIDLKDLHKALYRGEKKVFRIVPVKECFSCGYQSIESSSKKLVLICDKCGNLTYISIQIFLLYDELKALITEKQGYWLEWFLWRLLKNTYEADVGITIRKGNNEYEADIILISNNQKIFIECKDTSDDNFIKKLHAIKKDFDYYLLVSTCNIHKDSIQTAKNIFGNKFRYVTSDKIEKIVEIIRDLD